MRILIVEDQEKLAKLVQAGLKKEGIAADYVTDGESGLKRIELCHNDYDLIILDLMLPKVSGEEICRKIREKHIPNPVLILTAKDSTDDKVSLLDLGADDYLVKPFEFTELLARIRALTRRPQASCETELKVRDLILNPSTKKVTRGDAEIKLTLKEFRLLEYLMKNADRVVGREDIINNIWDYNFDSFSNVVDVYMNKLREKIDGGQEEKLLETVRGVGYKINA